MMGIFRSAELSFAAAASFMLLLAGCAAPETVSRDVHVKRGVTAEDDLIHFYGAPSQRIIRGDSEYFVYNARTMNITSADGKPYSWPTSKFVNNKVWVEFYDMQGNYFKKRAIHNA